MGIRILTIKADFHFCLVNFVLHTSLKVKGQNPYAIQFPCYCNTFKNL